MIVTSKANTVIDNVAAQTGSISRNTSDKLTNPIVQNGKLGGLAKRKVGDVEAELQSILDGGNMVSADGAVDLAGIQDAPMMLAQAGAAGAGGVGTVGGGAAGAKAAGAAAAGAGISAGAVAAIALGAVVVAGMAGGGDATARPSIIGTDISGTAAEMAAAVTGVTGFTGTVTITGDVAATLAQLVTINNGTAGTIFLNNETKDANFTGTAADLAAAFAGITNLNGNVTILEGAAATPAQMLAQLGTINSATTGTVTLNATMSATDFEGTAGGLVAALTEITGYTGDLTARDNVVSAGNLSALDAITTGTVNATFNTITGSSGAVVDIINAGSANINIGTQLTANWDATLTNPGAAVNSGQINTIDALTSGRITYDGSPNGYNTADTLNFTGVTGAITINGNDGVDTITGGAGINTINGGGGNDIIVGGVSNDIINGGGGNDTITGGAGNDAINGGDGADIIVVNAVVGASSDSGRVIVTGNANDTGGDTVTGFVFGTDTIRVVGTNVAGFVHGTNTAIGTAGAVNDGTVGSFLATVGLVNLEGGDSDFADAGDIAITFASTSVTMTETNFEAALQYTLTGNGDANTITTGGLADTINGGGGDDTTNGGGGNDTINGDGGNDTINGDGGNDTITGGTGADTITGGTGADIYVFAAGDSNTTTTDIIIGYETLEVIDHATLTLTRGSAATEASGTAGLVGDGSAATFNGDDVTLAQRFAAVELALRAGTNTAGEAAHFQFEANTYVFITDGVNGVGANDTFIQLTGIDSTNAAFNTLTIASGNLFLA